MSGCGEELIVGVNRSEEARAVEIPEGAWTDLLYDSAFPGGSYEIGPRGFMVLGLRP